MTAPMFRSVDALSGDRQDGPSKFFAVAGVEADARLAELEQLRAENAALKAGLSEWEVLQHELERLIGRYLHNAVDGDQQSALSNLSELMWRQSKFTTEMCRELHHWASSADDADSARRHAQEALEDLQASEIGDVQAHNNELFTENGRLRRRIQELETALAQAVSDRDTANAVGSRHV